MALKRILYIESNTDGTIGGSHFSLLFLIQGLNKQLYNPTVVFYQEHRLIPRYEQAGCNVLMMRKRRSLNLNIILPWLERMRNNAFLRILVKLPLMIFQKSVNYLITFLIPAIYSWYVLKKERIDLIHLNNTILRPQQWILAASFTKARVVAHERGINEEFPFQTRFWARFLSKIICISDAVYANLLKHGFSELQLVRIYNGLDPDEFIARRTRREVLLELGIPANSPVIGIVGNIKNWKGQETVIKSMINVRQIFPDIKCLIIGGVSPNDMDYFNKLKEFVKNENLDDCIVFTGRRNDIADLINSLSVMIHASILPEPFGRVLLEGMALKKPVITNNIGAGPEIVEDGKTGLVVKAGDETALATAITDLLNDPKKALKMGNAGRIRLEKFFTISDNIKQIENIYSEVGKP